MKYPDRPTVYLSPVRHKYHINWWIPVAILLSVGFTVFLIFCAAKAVR